MKKIILCSILLIILSLHSTSVYAYSCAYTELPREEMKQADVVFKGTLISNINHRLKFEIDKVWVGEIEGVARIRDANFIEAVIGEEYIIFAQTRSGNLVPLGCGNSGFATQELESILNQEPMKETTLFLIYLGISVFVVLIGILIIWLRRQMKEVE
ncbi:hypothetical protein [Bacillus alkalicellulosilyticus]|uniref:hypothetical protein n=1 Tax=Alkalihalobacterium alkalicellulosilyticum TaxID=1912214 RepID=UPI0009982B38|nr:hypothetical protein [Bacillus alkalicellulosilyticus]